MSYFLLPPKRWFFPSNKRIFNNQILVEIQRNLSSAERNSKHTLRYEKSQSTKINRISLFPSKSYFDNDSYNKSIQNNTNCNNSHHNHNVSVIFPTFKTSNISKSNNRMGIVRRFYSKKLVFMFMFICLFIFIFILCSCSCLCVYVCVYVYINVCGYVYVDVCVYVK
eukprot:Pgem_evm1s8034